LHVYLEKLAFLKRHRAITAFFVSGLILIASIYWFFSSTAPAQITGKQSVVSRSVPIKEVKATQNIVSDAPSPGTTTILPAATTLLQLRDTLEPRAAAGDAVAAARLAHDAIACAMADGDRFGMQVFLENAVWQRPDIAARHRVEREALPGRIAALQRMQRQVCAGVSKEQAFELARRAVLQAAQLGDAVSQLCAITYYFIDPDHRSLIGTYQDQAFARGDWRAVRLMALRTISDGPTIGGRVSSPPEPYDPVMYYRMMSLLQLGAKRPYAQDLQDELDSFDRLNSTILAHGGTGLSPEQADEATAWAQEQYKQYFALSPRMNAAPALCGEF
jgi:hypothetical protein